MPNVETPELGDLARDRVSGYEGIIIARTEWLNRCIRVGLQARGSQASGKPLDDCWCDIEQVEILQKGAYALKKSQTGGPMPTPQRLADPTR